MEYRGIEIEEQDCWIISAFDTTLKTLENLKGSITLNEEQKTLLFSFFYCGILYGENMADKGD